MKYTLYNDFDEPITHGQLVSVDDVMDLITEKFSIETCSVRRMSELN